MSQERPTMDGNEKPFDYMLRPGFQAEIEEYINIQSPDSDAINAHKQRESLDRLKLSESSSAEEVRKRAGEIKVQFGWFLVNGEGGGYEHIAHDLFFVLCHTRDVYDLEDTLLFLFTNNNLEQVRHMHKLFHNINTSEE